MKSLIKFTFPLSLLLLIALLSSAQSVKEGIEIGNKAPNISMKSPDGTTQSLSDIKGKYVLIDFWASWCGPCRRENPTVVKVYHTYKDQKFKNGNGFDVFSVSLDKTPDAWKKGIADDKLVWKWHVSDLKGWQSGIARVYSVRSIPMNFLINPEGIIIARNLRGEALEAELKKHLQK